MPWTLKHGNEVWKRSSTKLHSQNIRVTSAFIGARFGINLINSSGKSEETYSHTCLQFNQRPASLHRVQSAVTVTDEG